ncbi:hypothetical protein quinque_004494 [Culex quinquefasciatus]
MEFREGIGWWITLLLLIPINAGHRLSLKDIRKHYYGDQDVEISEEYRALQNDIRRELAGLDPKLLKHFYVDSEECEEVNCLGHSFEEEDDEREGSEEVTERSTMRPKNKKATRKLKRVEVEEQEHYSNYDNHIYNKNNHVNNSETDHNNNVNDSKTDNDNDQDHSQTVNNSETDHNNNNNHNEISNNNDHNHNINHGSSLNNRFFVQQSSEEHPVRPALIPATPSPKFIPIINPTALSLPKSAVNSNDVLARIYNKLHKLKLLKHHRQKADAGSSRKKPGSRSKTALDQTALLNRLALDENQFATVGEIVVKFPGHQPPGQKSGASRKPRHQPNPSRNRLRRQESGRKRMQQEKKKARKLKKLLKEAQRKFKKESKKKKRELGA